MGLKPIRMDIFIQEENQNFNVEMQTHNLGPLPQRGRWYKTTYDKSLRAAEQYADIKPFYLIFICDYDIIELEEKSGYARYTRTSYWEENMVPAEDGYHLIVFNTRYKKDEMHTHMVDNEILELLDYIRTDDDSATYQGDLANKSRDAVHRLRMDPVLKEEYKVVSMYIAGQRAEAFAEGESEGIKKNKLCFKYLKEGYSPAQIAAALGEDLDKIQEPLKAAQDMIAM